MEPIDQVLGWIGFNTPNQLAAMRENFDDLNDFGNLKESDITEIADSYARRPAAQRMHIGLARTKRLKALIHWVGDFHRLSREPSLDGLDQDSFRQELLVAQERAEIRKDEAKKYENLAKEATPGKLTSDKVWPKWIMQFTNLLSIIPGVTGVPLSYVIRENANPMFDDNANFTTNCVNCAPLAGTRFQADDKAVHQLVLSFVTGEHAEEFVKPLARRQSGRADIAALRNHFDGEGNTSRRIAEAERLRDNLIYKSERSLPFTQFLSRLQHMFTLFEKENEPYTEAAMIRALFSKVQHPDLQRTVDALKVQMTMGTVLTFTTAANHLASALSEISTTDGRRASAVVIPRSSMIYDSSGKINTGHHENWYSLTREERDAVIAERKRLGIKGPKGKKKRRVSAVKRAKQKLQQLEQTLAETNRQISAIRQATPAVNDGTPAPTGTTPAANAGDAFGGRAARAGGSQVSKVNTTPRRLSQVALKPQIPSTPLGVYHSTVELDSHADTIVCGRNCIVLHGTGRECDVLPYSDTYESIKAVPIVSAATAWTSESTGETFILVFNEALWMGDHLDHTLVNPNQLRHFGVHVQDNPTLDSPLFIATEDLSFHLPLSARGTTIMVNTRTPTELELQECPHIVLSSPKPWDPQSVDFYRPRRTVEEEMEQLRMVHGVSAVRKSGTAGLGDTQDVSCGEESDGFIFNVQEFQHRLVSSVRVREVKSLNVSGVLDDVNHPKTFVSKERKSAVTAAEISERWFIGLAQAAKTLASTTQRVLRSALLPLGRRYRADRIHQRHTIAGDWYTDTIDAHCTSAEGNKYAQIFCNRGYFAHLYPMSTKAEAGEALRLFCQEFGVPERLTFDGSKEQTCKGTEFMRQIRRNDIDYHIIEPYRHNENIGEGVVREVKRKWFRIMSKKRVPRRFWDYGYKWSAEIISRTYTRMHRLDGGVPLEQVTGETVDISEYLDFGFYDFCWVRENAGLGENVLCRWLGISHRIGTQLAYKVLKSNGQVISRTSVQAVTALELQTDDVRQKCKAFDDEIARRLHDDELPAIDSSVEAWADYLAVDREFLEEAVISADDVTHAEDAYTPDVLDDTYLNMELALPQDGDLEPKFARVTKRLRDANGLPIGTANENPILDTRVYEVEYADGRIASMAANQIAENLFAQVDAEGNRHVLLDEIVDHRKNQDALDPADAFITTRSGAKRRIPTTRGWDIRCQWKDGSSTWVALKDMKEAYPVQVAEYAVTSRIADQPAFAWWIPYVLKKRDRILAKVKSKYWIRTHKFGIRIPKTVEDAKAEDARNGNTLWWDAICKEMRNVRIAFEVFEGTKNDIPPGYQQIRCHMIFDIKMGENFRRKARMVAGGHTTETPASITYSSVVSRDSVRIALLIAALNDLRILACDIQNAYLTAKCREKIWTIAGPEFGSEAGSIMLVTRALYGLKSSGAAFRALFADHLWNLDYRPSEADNDVWMRPAVKENGFEYYEYVLCYVDDILSISHRPETTMDAIRKEFKLKNDEAAEPEDYLGATLGKMKLSDGTECWTMSSDKYCKAAVSNVEAKLAESGKRLPSGVKTPFHSGYKPELDVTPELKADGVQYFQELIGVLRWACELGRCDILLEVSLLSQHLACPRLGHLEEAMHVFAYLKTFPKRKLAFDPRHPRIDERRFQKYDWHDFYRGAEEAIPSNKPKCRGNSMSIHCFVDANHAGNTVNRKSQTGILIFCNMAPVIWYSKKQNTVEASTFGAEIVAMKNAIELIVALRYKLRMFGVPIEGPADIFCDNEAVYKNCSIPESVLKKKHHSIAYHYNRRAVASGTCRIAKEDTATNLSDLFTKVLVQTRRESLMDRFMY